MSTVHNHGIDPSCGEQLVGECLLKKGAVVLDLSSDPHAVARLREVAERYLKHKYDYAHDLLVSIADQIEAQTKPPRIPEPGWGGIVLSTGSGSHGEPMRWVRGDKGWTSLDATGAYLNWTDWGDLNDPTLVREGVES